MKKRILICCDYMAPYEGNFISSIKKLDAVLNQKYEIDYMFPLGTNGDFLIWFSLFSKNHKVTTYEPFCYNTIVEQASKEYDLIYLHFYSIEFARNLCKQTGKKVILHGHHKPILKKWRGFVEYIKSFKFRYKNLYIIACSRGVQKAYSLMQRSHNVYLSTNCIDFDRIDSLKKVVVKEKCPGFVLSMYGGEYFTKGVDIALKALRVLNDRDIKLKIYCSHNLEENRKIVHEQFSNVNAEVLPYRLNPCEVYLNSDVFLAPSRFEGFNYSILECTYCSVPVIASNLKEHMHKDCPYVFFRNGCYKSLSKAIKHVKEIKPALVNKEKIRENFDILNWVGNINTIIGSILEV